MKKITMFLNVCLMAGVIMLNSCAKDGETGPQGPAGPQGAQGPQGNANVKSNTITVASGDWVLSGNIYYYDAYMPNINSDIVNTGSVHIFMESTSQFGIWLNMPWVEPISSSMFSTYNFNFGLNSIRIFKMDSDLTPPSNPGARKFKVVVISASARKANPNIDWTDYNQVKKCLNIQE